MAKILKCPGCNQEIRTDKTRDLNKHMNLNENLCKGQCLPALHLMQNPVPIGNPPIQNPAKNPILTQNSIPTPEGDLISFDEHLPTSRKVNMLADDLLTDDIKVGPKIKNNKKIRSKPISRTDKEWFDLMKSNNDNKDSEPSDSEYDTADEDPDIYFEKIVDLYINRISEAENFNKGEVCNYYTSVPKEYFAKEIIREDRINASIEKGYNEIIDKIEDEALQESGCSYLPLPEALDKPQLGIINPQNRDNNKEEAIKANRKPPHLNEIRRLRRNANIANFEGIKFLATLHDIDKFEESNSNYAINIFKPFYREAFRKIKVDIDLLHISECNYQVEHMIDLLYLTEGSNKASQYLILSEEDKNYVKPKYIKNMLMKPYLITMDLEAKEIEADEKDKEENTIKEVKQIAVSYGYTIYCSDRTTQKPVINQKSENIIKDLMENLQEDLEVILDKLCEIASCEKMIPKLWQKYQTANKCWICEEKLHEAGYNKICIFDPETKKYLGAPHRKYHGKKLMIQDKLDNEQKEKHKSCKTCLYCKTHLPDKEKNRVIDHNHITGKFRGPAHSGCNLKLRINPEIIKIPILICNGSGYNFHHFIQKIEKMTNEKIVPITNNSKQYITFLVGQLQFIDSLKFSLPGLAKMAENLCDEKKGQTKTPEQLAKCFPIMSKFISPHLLSLLTHKGIFLYHDLNEINYCKQRYKSKECEYEKIYIITQKDYDFAHTIWKETACKTFSDYHDIYFKMNVLILADAFKAFQKASYSAFKLDSANYLTEPGDMHDFFTAMKREGMFLARRRIARANILGLEGSKQKEWVDKQYSDTEKLILTLYDKDHYVIHYRNLQQCIKEGYVLKKVYRILAKNAFEKDFWKLMNNSVFEKTMEDVRKRVNIDLVRQVDEEQRLHRLISDSAFVSKKIFYGANLVAVHQRQTNIKLNKPEYVRHLYTNTDSLIIEIETKNIYQDMIDNCDLFDFSDYPKDHWWKDENRGNHAIGYAEVYAKCYSIVCENSQKNMIKAKSLKKSLIKKELTHKIFEDCILEGKEDQT
ncbi:16128_t:CDS:10 [Cetraspora pellucida]|uniref:16128_t:CDS:1 n=1 Tax=Cetraspora pellucida TaxID=1433469 RepID=A0A9N9AU27_9GLOM|nr:16128_t:CDS:10 [Cetraspora pellucida]